jgi:hypothetical protein
MACVSRLLSVWMEIMVAPVVTISSLPTIRILAIVWASDTIQGPMVRAYLDLGSSCVVALTSAIGGSIPIVTSIYLVVATAHDVRLANAILVLE